MSGVRILVGTRKGAFVLTSDGARRRWEVAGPHFGSPDAPLPDAVVKGEQPLLILGAIAGG